MILAPADHVMADSVRCAGCFSADNEGSPVLAVAWGVPSEQRLGTLLHEYSHLTQWAEGAPVWRLDQSAAWSKWLEGRRVNNIAEKIASSRELEADCERRTVRLIRELDAPLDVERYCRQANGYVHFYNVMAARRKWYAPGRGPYASPEVSAAANPTLDQDYSKTPPKLWAALEACLAQ